MTADEIRAQYRICKLAENEGVVSFDCGDADEPTRLLYFDLSDLDED